MHNKKISKPLTSDDLDNTSCEIPPCLEQVPYLEIQTPGPSYAEFHFRGAFGRMQSCALGLCVALSFPPHPDYLAQAQHISLLLAASEQTLDFGLQREGERWLLWKRFDANALNSPAAIRIALDNLLALMRFLHGQFSTPKRPPSSHAHQQPLAARFV